ncbi:MAG: MFS transporter [Xanthomonadales bacterium]|nr:MFS transporter [Xanthomonadales bacterium]
MDSPGTPATRHEDTASSGPSSTAWGGVGTLASVLGLRMLGLFMVLPVLALYAERLPGATPLMVGLALGIYGLTQAGLQIPMGRLSDRIGRKPVIIFGLLVFVLGSILAALADSAAWLVAGRALQGAGAISAAVTALVGDITTPARRTRAMAVIGISIGMAFMLAFIVGPVLSAWVGVAGLFWVTAALGVGSMLVVMVFIKSPALPVAPKTTNFWAALPSVAPEVAMVLVLHALLTAAFLVVPQLIVARLDLPAAQHGWVYLPVMLGSVLVMGPLILLQERLSRRLALVLAVLFIGAGMAAWLLPDGKWPLYVGLLLFFGGFNFVEAHLPARVSLKAGDGDRGTAMGWYATGQFLGAFVGGGAGGWLLGLAGNEAVAYAGIAAAAVWLVLVTKGGHGRES